MWVIAAVSDVVVMRPWAINASSRASCDGSMGIGQLDVQHRPAC